MWGLVINIHCCAFTQSLLALSHPYLVPFPFLLSLHCTSFCEMFFFTYFILFCKDNAFYIDPVPCMLDCAFTKIPYLICYQPLALICSCAMQLLLKRLCVIQLFLHARTFVALFQFLHTQLLTWEAKMCILELKVACRCFFWLCKLMTVWHRALFRWLFAFYSICVHCYKKIRPRCHSWFMVLATLVFQGNRCTEYSASLAGERRIKTIRNKEYMYLWNYVYTLWYVRHGTLWRHIDIKKR